MPLHPLRVDLSTVQPGTVDHACLVLGLDDGDRYIFLMAGVHSEQFVKLEMPSGLQVDLLALSHDGSRIAMWTNDYHLPNDDLCIVDLAAGTEIRLPGHGPGTMAAFAPDGTLAAVSGKGEEQGIELRIIDAGGTVRRRFVIDAGTRLGESTVSWSPDGRLIAYEAYMQGSELEAVVVARPDTGEVIRVRQGLMLLNSSDGTWLDNETLVMVDEYAPTDKSDLVLVDVRTGAESVLDVSWPGGYILRAVTGRRFLWAEYGSAGMMSLRIRRLGETAHYEIATLAPGTPSIRRLEFSPTLVGVWDSRAESTSIVG